MCGRGSTRRQRWLRAVTAGVGLLVGSIVPVPLARHPELGRFGPDKLLHLLGHGGLAAALADALVADCRDPRLAGLLAAVGSTAIGAVAAYIQQYVPGRAPERADTVAGLLGTAVGIYWWATASDRTEPAAGRPADAEGRESS